MRSSLLLTVSVLAASTIAIPTRGQTRRSSCTTQLPTTYQQISSSQPSTSFPQGDIFLVNQTAGGSTDVDTLVHFTDIPSNSYGCELAVSFTYEYPINSSGSTLLNVYALPHDIQPADTYTTYFPNGGNGAPQGSSLWGSVTLDGQKHVINSESCSANLSFLFEIASDQAGSVSFRDAGDNLSGIGGFYLSYDC